MGEEFGQPLETLLVKNPRFRIGSFKDFTSFVIVPVNYPKYPYLIVQLVI